MEAGEERSGSMDSHTVRSARRCGVPGVAVTLICALAVGCKPTNTYVAPPPPKVTVAPPEQQKVTLYLHATGNTVAYNSVTLLARVQGFLQDIGYQDGTSVKKGTNLFTIEPLPYLAKLQQAQAAEAGDKAQVTLKETDFQRQASLLKQDVTSQRNYDTAKAQRDQAVADYQQAQANTQIAAINYSYTRVMAPFDGVVSAHLVSVGEVVGGSGEPTKLATIVQQSPIYVTFNVSEQDVLRIRAMVRARGMGPADLSKVPVEIGLQTETGYPHEGHLDYASPTVDQNTGTLQARGILENKERVLLPGYFVRVRVPLERNVAKLLVPDVAVGADQGGRYVLVVDGNDTVQQVHVQLGPEVGALRVVESGLKPTDRVVVDGLERAIPGQKVSPEVKVAAAATPIRQAAR